MSVGKDRLAVGDDVGEGCSSRAFAGVVAVLEPPVEQAKVVNNESVRRIKPARPARMLIEMATP